MIAPAVSDPKREPSCAIQSRRRAVFVDGKDYGQRRLVCGAGGPAILELRRVAAPRDERQRHGGAEVSQYLEFANTRRPADSGETPDGRRKGMVTAPNVACAG